VLYIKHSHHLNMSQTKEQNTSSSACTRVITIPPARLIVVASDSHTDIAPHFLVKRRHFIVKPLQPDWNRLRVENLGQLVFSSCHFFSR